MQTNISEEEMKIIKLFKDNVYGRKPNTDDSNQAHDGKGGHWLERQMGIVANAANQPDLFGYEMKNNTTSKTTFGDWSASYRIFRNKELNLMTQTDFVRIFGRPNPDKNGRYSWSGDPVPKINNPSPYNGSVMVIDDEHNISIIYNYSTDPRPDKASIVPTKFQKDNLILMRWTKEELEKKLLNKFGRHGWFKCSKNKNGEYSEISFGAPMTYENWIERVKQGIVKFDCGMREDSKKPYASWRANNTYWRSLITHTYPPFPSDLDNI